MPSVTVSWSPHEQPLKAVHSAALHCLTPAFCPCLLCVVQLEGSMHNDGETQELACLACVLAASSHEMVRPRLCRAHRRAFGAEMTEALGQYPRVWPALMCLLRG
jgi:hypothetical protein